MATAIRAAGAAIPALGEQLTGPIRILDVGTGVGWLAVALARAYPEATVAGIDIFPPALELARANAAGTEVADRVELRQQDALALPANGEFTACWLPLPFLPPAIVPDVLAAVRGTLHPRAGG